jgi:hypothetical protein
MIRLLVDHGEVIRFDDRAEDTPRALVTST